jgi:RNA polymerase sigma factor (sigma-70 family)
LKDDKRAFWARMFTKHQSALTGFFRRRVAHPWDAQDLAQEVYLRLLRVDSRDGSAIDNPEAYLYTVAANLVKEHGVLQKRVPQSLDIASVFPELEAPGGSAQDEVERDARYAWLRDTLDRLPPRCRAVMVMQYRDNMSYEQIAAELGVSTHMVKKTVVKALALCRGLARYS